MYTAIYNLLVDFLFNGATLSGNEELTVILLASIFSIATVIFPFYLVFIFFRSLLS